MTNRPIKFRAWSSLSREMYEGVQNGDFAGFLYGEHFEVMQFTGLHDKNGKEIYGGDVVFVTHKYGPNITGEVYYDEAFACYRIKGDNITDWVDRAGCFEVIGNIYENPNLIEHGNHD